MRLPSKAEIALMFASVIFALACAEVGARVWLKFFATREQYLQYALYTDIKSSDLKYRPHQYLDYVPTPNFREGVTTHNSLGFRGEEFPKEKPRGEFRIVAIGGSTTYDEDVPDDKEIHTAQLEEILRTKYGYPNVRVINGGVPGYNSFESLVNLEFRVLDINPDMILHYDNNNDVHTRLVLPKTYAGDNSAKRMPWTAPSIPRREWSVFARIVSRYLHYTRQMGLEDFVDPHQPFWVMGYDESIGGDPMKVLDQNPPIYFERNTRNMVAIEKEHGIIPVLVTWAYSPYFNDYAATPHYQKAYAEHNRVYQHIAETENLPLLDLAAVMPPDKEYYTDGRHSSAKGARKRAEFYAEFLASHNLLPKE